MPSVRPPAASGSDVLTLPVDGAGGAPAERDPAGALPGLVICAKTARAPDVQALAASDLRFPRVDLLDAAAQLVNAATAWNGHEGPRSRLVIGPGVIAVERP